MITTLTTKNGNVKCQIKERHPKKERTEASVIAQLFVNATKVSTRTIPDTLFGIFFEEINHAGAGGLWAELVDNRGFKAGGQATPSDIAPWFILGDESLLVLSTDRSSCFERTKVALPMEVFCSSKGSMICPNEGVGVYNPGFWGMGITCIYGEISSRISLSMCLALQVGS
ncbi:hypothetical protein AgCh_013739 [Apium graveolens]